MKTLPYVLVLCLLASCGREGARVPPPGWLRDEGDRLAAAEDWGRAAECYRGAYALEDPEPARARARAHLAFRCGIARARGGQPFLARGWFDRALRLDPSLNAARFEIGRLHDGEHPETADPVAALDAYGRFLEAYAETGAPERDTPLAERARERLAALGEEAPPGDASSGD